jgi:serine/threonine protein kinase
MTVSAVITTQALHIGPYTVETRLAKGGQASVHLARNRDEAPESWVVLKTLNTDSTFTSSSALHQEVEALTWAEHPNVIRLIGHDLGHEPPYLVLEYVAGVDLHKLLRLSAPGGGGVPEELACFLCMNIASALVALHGEHDRGNLRIFHGDVSPSNILLSEHGDVKLSDFGLSRIERDTFAPESRTATLRQPTWGHRGYLAPERLTGAPASAPADVFALAAILGELLIGRSVFEGETELARLISMKEANLTPLLHRADVVSSELIDVCRRCLDPNPTRRPSAVALNDVLNARLEQTSMSEARLRRSLSSWVTWAKQQAASPAKAEEQVRQSLHVMRASQRVSGQIPRGSDADAGRAMLRSVTTKSTQTLSYSELVALAASGKLNARDEVSLFGKNFEPVAQIPALARHLLPSSTALTSEVSPFGPADYCEDLSEISLITLIGRLLVKKATGLLVVGRPVDGHTDRKDIYVQEGRVTHISSTEPNDRLGESLIQAGVLTRRELSLALRHMVRTQGQLGESLVALQLVDPVVVYQALCSQGRDRIVRLCTWSTGTARFFSGVARPEVAFPLDVDLHLCLVEAVDAVAHAVPDPQSRIVPLPACPPPRSTPTALPLLNLVPSIARKRVTVSTAIEELTHLSARGVTTNPATYLLVAHTLGWIDFA